MTTTQFYSFGQCDGFCCLNQAMTPEYSMSVAHMAQDGPVLFEAEKPLICLLHILPLPKTMSTSEVPRTLS